MKGYGHRQMDRQTTLTVMPQTWLKNILCFPTSKLLLILLNNSKMLKLVKKIDTPNASVGSHHRYSNLFVFLAIEIDDSIEYRKIEDI